MLNCDAGDLVILYIGVKISAGKSEESGHHLRLLGNCLISVELLLLYMTQSILLMGNCSCETLVKTRGFGWGHF